LAYNSGKLLKSLEIFEKAIGVAKNDLEWLNASTSVENIRSHLFGKNGMKLGEFF
jgi:hypothetical protein